MLGWNFVFHFLPLVLLLLNCCKVSIPTDSTPTLQIFMSSYEDVSNTAMRFLDFSANVKSRMTFSSQLLPLILPISSFHICKLTQRSAAVLYLCCSKPQTCYLLSCMLKSIPEIGSLNLYMNNTFCYKIFPLKIF